MTDKVQLIKQEIERQIDYAEDDTRYTESYREGLIAAYQTIKAFIDNSLPEEPKKQPKFKVGDTIKGPCNNIFQVKEMLDKQYLLHSENGDELNSIEIVDKYSCILEEPASEDLKKEISKWRNHYISVLDNNLRIDLRDIEVTANHFAEWQKQKDQETIELAEDHAMLAGMNKMKEEMMKDAADSKITTDGNSIFPIIKYQLPLTYDCKIGDKVKLIIIKEEQ